MNNIISSLLAHAKHILIYRCEYSFPFSPERPGTMGTNSDTKPFPESLQDYRIRERSVFGLPEREGT